MELNEINAEADRYVKSRYGQKDWRFVAGAREGFADGYLAAKLHFEAEIRRLRYEFEKALRDAQNGR